MLGAAALSPSSRRGPFQAAFNERSQQWLNPSKGRDELAPRLSAFFGPRCPTRSWRVAAYFRTTLTTPYGLTTLVGSSSHALARLKAPLGPAARQPKALCAAPPRLRPPNLNGEIVLLGRLYGIPTPVNAELCLVASEMVGRGRGGTHLAPRLRAARLAQVRTR
jgi:hypothetical protein